MPRRRRQSPRATRRHDNIVRLGVFRRFAAVVQRRDGVAKGSFRVRSCSLRDGWGRSRLETSASISACTRSSNCACCSLSLGRSLLAADRSSVSLPLPASVVQTGCKPTSADDGQSPKTFAAATLATNAAVATGGGGGGGPGRGGFFFFSPGGAGGGFAAMVCLLVRSRRRRDQYAL